jgi:hypothetical protein
MDPGDKVRHKALGLIARIESTRFGLPDKGDTRGSSTDPIEYVTVRLPWCRWAEWPSSEVELVEAAPFGGLFEEGENA